MMEVAKFKTWSKGLLCKTSLHQFVTGKVRSLPTRTVCNSVSKHTIGEETWHVCIHVTYTVSDTDTVSTSRCLDNQIDNQSDCQCNTASACLKKN